MVFYYDAKYLPAGLIGVAIWYAVLVATIYLPVMLYNQQYTLGLLVAGALSILQAYMIIRNKIKYPI